MENLINAMPLLLIMAIFWIGWQLHSIQIQKMDRSIDRLETAMGFMLHHLEELDPEFYKKMESYIHHLEEE